MMYDLNNDGKSDIVGFGMGGVWVSMSSGYSFSTPDLVINDFGDVTWTVEGSFRTVGDIDGDGIGDVIGMRDDVNGNCCVWVY